MTPADQYRVKAGDLASLARAEKDPFQKAEYERLSLAFLRLADQADRNTEHAASIDPLIVKPADQVQIQQQQQSPPEKPEK
jgi:hypothetical protein